MSIIGPHPTSGFRLDLLRETDLSPWRYSGQLVTPLLQVPLTVDIEANGDVVIAAEIEATLAERVRLLVRQVIKHALSEGQTPPRRIQRWRP